MSTTTKNVAKAIAILSDVLSAEVENEPWTDSEEATEEEIEETVPLEDYEEMVEKSEDFSVDILSDLQNLRDDLVLHIDNNEDDEDEDYDSSFGEWDEDEEDDESADSDDDASTASDAAPVTDAPTEETESVSESDSDKILDLESMVAELKDVITDAVDTLNDIISNAEDFNSDVESW